MARSIRIFDGSFGRLQLLEAEAEDSLQTAVAPQIVMLHEGAGLDVVVDGEPQHLTRDNLLFLNPGAASQVAPGAGGHTQLLVFQASTDWLRGRFPAVFDAVARPFPAGSEAINPRIRQLADTLVIEALNDQFLSHERLEFMLQELMLSIVETCLARRAAGARM